MTASCDILVIGAGAAGTLAAVAAARSGARTILIERESYLGGTAYAAMVRDVCGLYLNGEDMPGDTLNPGIVREAAAMLLAASPGNRIKRIGQVHVLSCSPEDLQQAFTSLCYAEKDLAVMRGHTVDAVNVESGVITSVSLKGARGEQELEAAMVIDCSGSGELSALAGAECDLAPQEQRQLAGFTIHVRGMKQPDDTLAIKIPYILDKAVSESTLSPLMRFTAFSLGSEPDEGYCKMSREPGETPDRDDKARADAFALHAYLSASLPEFQGSFISAMSPQVLDREGRRVRGEYMLTADDVLAARKFPDGIVRNAWPIERWSREQGTEYHYVPRGDHYEIPFRCMVAAGMRNLLMAGRCVSATGEALGSARVVGTCMAMGEQAGKAAAYRVQHGVYPEYVKDV